MKKTIFTLIFLLMTGSISAERLCDVTICNKISRFSLSIWSHVKDKFGEECFDIKIPESEATPGKILSSESRWYQGSSINPTKKSVTKIKSVGVCK